MSQSTLYFQQRSRVQRQNAVTRRAAVEANQRVIDLIFDGAKDAVVFLALAKAEAAEDAQFEAEKEAHAFGAEVQA